MVRIGEPNLIFGIPKRVLDMIPHEKGRIDSVKFCFTNQGPARVIVIGDDDVTLGVFFLRAIEGDTEKEFILFIHDFVKTLAGTQSRMIQTCTVVFTRDDWCTVSTLLMPEVPPKRLDDIFKKLVLSTTNPAPEYEP